MTTSETEIHYLLAWGKENKHAVQSALIYEAAQTHASFTDLFVPSLSSQAEDGVAHQHTESEPSRAPGATRQGLLCATCTNPKAHRSAARSCACQQQ